MPRCLIPEAGAERLDRLQARAVALRIPLEGTVELTRRCNLRCIHCYLGGRPDAGDREMPTAAARRVLGQLVEAGTLHLTLTGGEPLLRGDFPELYGRAASAGMLVTVFTNATLVDAAIVRLFREHPPRRVEVTFPGATRDTFEAISRVSGSFSRCREGVRRLLDAGVRVSLKTVVMRRNLGEIAAIEEIAREYGVPFRYDTALFPGLPDAAGSQRPSPGELSELRVSPEEAVALDAASPARRAPWLAAHATDPAPDGSRLLFRCGAGLTNFHVDHEGFLTPCLLIPGTRHDLKSASFAEGWDGPVAALRGQLAREGFACAGCDAGSLCAACPALFALEGGAPDAPSAYHCRTGRERYARLTGRAIIGASREEP